MPYIIKIYDTYKTLGSIEYREHISLCLCNDRCQGAQIHLGSNGHKILFNHIGNFQGGEHSLILMVGYQLTALCKTYCIYIILVKDLDGKI